jgi:hypothetical protein
MPLTLEDLFSKKLVFKKGRWALSPPKNFRRREARAGKRLS